MFYTIYPYIYICQGYLTACGAQLIRFSFPTNTSCPQKIGYMQATYKGGRVHKNTIWHHSSQETTRACGSVVSTYTK